MGHCTGSACSDITKQAISGAGTVAGRAPVTIGVDGLPLIAFYDSAAKDLRVLHCSNPWCVPYASQR